MQKAKTNYTRTPVYIFIALGVLLLFSLTTLFAARSSVGQLEEAVFTVFYRLPAFLTPPFIAITMLGSMTTSLLVAVILLLFKRADIALRLAVVAVMAHVVVDLLKNWIERGRPITFFPWVVERVPVKGYGFPSGHAAMAAAAGLTLALYVPRTYRKWIIGGFILIGCSRLYLGVHLPLDVIGGWLVGIFCYAFVSLALGSHYAPISTEKLAKKLMAGGLKNVVLKPASVDARGSVPFFGEYEGGKLFVKVFNQDNNAADWLFKTFRRLQYRRLEDEVPSLTPKRAIEHEAYLTMLATHKAKVRVPEFLGVFRVGQNSYAMALRRIDADGLDGIASSKITDDLLAGAWQQIKKLHASNIIHKDLRCANVMIEKKTGLPWLIDFGFSEAAINQKSFYKDNVEFIASSATKVGAKRAVAAALKALGKKELGEALPYMQYAALSGATTTTLKNTPGLLEKIRTEMANAANEDTDQKAKLSRLSLKGR